MSSGLRNGDIAPTAKPPVAQYVLSSARANQVGDGAGATQVKIENNVYRVRQGSGGSWLERISRPFATALGPGRYPLRFSLVEADEHAVVIESTVVRFDPVEKYASALNTIELLEPRRKTLSCSPFGVVHIVPTGIRCEFGGFAGDATPVTNLLASTADFLVTHPNAVNASDLN